VPPKTLELPAANEFSPGQVDLKKVLEIVSTHEGDRVRLVEELRSEYFAQSASKRTNPDERLGQQRVRANNVLVGLSGYGIFNLDQNHLTEFGRRLSSVEASSELYDVFAKHILDTRHGYDVLRALAALRARHERPTKASLDQELRGMGFILPRATTHHTKLLAWLGKAGIVSERYTVEDEALARVSGVRAAALHDWDRLTSAQQAFLRTVRESAEVHGIAYVPSRPLVDRAELQHGKIFKSDQLMAQIFRPLAQAGWIALQIRQEGRGGKSPPIAATEKLLTIPITVLTGESEWGLPPELRASLDKPLDQIRLDLKSKDTHVAGLALEVLAVRLATDLGLSPVKLRLRARQTGGAEVDLIAEAAHLHFSRWLFQCKNVRGSVDLSALAKEIGVAVLLRAHVIVMVTTGSFRRSVTEHAERLAETTATQAVLVDQRALADYEKGGAQSIMSFFHKYASQTMTLKKSQVDAADVLPDEDAP
jgi:hypothetical protein